MQIKRGLRTGTHMFLISKGLCWSSSNYYRLLKLDAASSAQQIRDRYLQLAKTMHPDLNAGKTDEEFSKIKQAYQALSNPKTRRQHDLLLGLDSSSWDRLDQLQEHFYNNPETYEKMMNAKNSSFNKKPYQTLFEECTEKDADLINNVGANELVKGLWKAVLGYLVFYGLWVAAKEIALKTNEARRLEESRQAKGAGFSARMLPLNIV